MHVCVDLLTLNMGRCFAGCQTNVVREASAWQRAVCRRRSMQWSRARRVNVRRGIEKVLVKEALGREHISR